MIKNIIRKYAIAVLLLISESIFALQTPMKVVSYNILSPLYLSYGNYDKLPDQVIAWEHRRDRILKILIGANADVICLQEIDEDSFIYLSNQLHALSYKGVFAKPIKPKKDSVAIFYNSKRFKLFAENAHKFRGFTKVFQEVHLQDNAGDIITIINAKTQWDAEDKGINEHRGFKQLSYLGRAMHLGTASNHTILCGDFNLEPKQLAMVEFIKGFNDAHADKDFYTIQIGDHAKRIDYILASSDLEVIASGPLLNKEYVYTSPSIESPSDHLPIVAELK